ncbi:hypothetical protein BDF21DRAFT_418942 [Thamnidium elegans]|nr:hypothetical protein BDF21DRAFT_418942 [Thamnidium elegans]
MACFTIAALSISVEEGLALALILTLALALPIALALIIPDSETVELILKLHVYLRLLGVILLQVYGWNSSSSTT